MNGLNLLRRCLVFGIGLFIMAVGVVLSVKAHLGTSPISCPPYVFSVAFPLTMGTTTILMNLFLVLAQMALLRKNYQWTQLSQILAVVVFGFFIDLCTKMLNWIDVSNYILQWTLCLLSCVVLAFGVFLEVKAGVSYLPGEGFAMALSKVYKIEFGKTKVAVDSMLVIVGVLSSFVFLHRLEGAREGTVAAALLVGVIVRLYVKNLPFIDKIMGVNEAEKMADVEVIPNVADGKFVVTIAREYGSGGHEIGELLAKKLGIGFYDSHLIDLTAEKSGFTPEYVREHEQKLTNTLLYDLYEQNYAYTDDEKPPLDALFMVQSKVIREIADRESCVIVGRCADFILKEYPAFTLFVHADKPYRINRIKAELNTNEAMATKAIEKRDTERMNYSRKFTQQEWNDAQHYDLTIDSSHLGTEACVDLIVSAVDSWKKQRSKV